MSTPPVSATPTPPVATTIISLSEQAFAMQFDASLPSVLPTNNDEPKYLGSFSAEQEHAILETILQTFKKQPQPPASSE